MRHVNLYIDYATCSQCGFKKFCRLQGRQFLCKSCDVINLKEQQEKKS